MEDDYILYIPGLVNVYIANWKITMLSMGKSTISMAIFNSYFDITRGYLVGGLEHEFYCSIQLGME